MCVKSQRATSGVLNEKIIEQIIYFKIWQDTAALICANLESPVTSPSSELNIKLNFPVIHFRAIRRAHRLCVRCNQQPPLRTPSKFVNNKILGPSTQSLSHNGNMTSTNIFIVTDEPDSKDYRVSSIDEMSTSSGLKFFEAIRDTILIAVHQ